jgi:pimeloyl-ACP methyl ester carboxylesterase
MGFVSSLVNTHPEAARKISTSSRSPQQSGLRAIVLRPAARRARVRSAATKVFPTPVSVPVKFIQGGEDERVPLDITENYIAAMKAHGQQIELEVLAGTTHFEMMDIPSATFDALLRSIN